MPRKLRNIELNRLSLDEFKSAKKYPLVLILDDIRSMNNVGSLFRTADALLIEAICLCGITGRPPHKDIRKTALGAEESVNWFGFDSVSSCIAHYRDLGYSIWSLEQTDRSIDIREIPADHGPVALIVGNEIDGVSEEAIQQSDLILEIPQYGSKHSLNVAVSGSMALWEILRNKIP